MAKCKRCRKLSLSSHLSESGLCASCMLVLSEEKNKQYQSRLADMERELIAVRNSITPDMQELITLRRSIEKSKAQCIMLGKQHDQGIQDIHNQEEHLEQLKKQIMVADDTIELESFSLYTPKFDFARSEEYKDRLGKSIEEQKKMIRDKTAASFSYKFTVNDSKSKGKQLIDDIVKLFLRSFNNECDMAVSAVRFSNFERCEERIRRSYTTINKLGRINDVSISKRYLDLKLEELFLATDYQIKKEKEKEELRALREQQREEAKFLKEAEAARKEAEKEKKHYQLAIERMQQQILDCKNEEDREELLKKNNELTEHLDDIMAKLADIDYRQSNQKAGYVYIISNIGSFGEGVYKIGMTRRLDPMERVYELGDASVPFMFDVHALIFSDDAPRLEAALHQAFAAKRVNRVNNRREYFRVTLEEIKEVVLKNHDKTVEFTDVPIAQQYRETLLINK